MFPNEVFFIKNTLRLPRILSLQKRDTKNLRKMSQSKIIWVQKILLMFTMNELLNFKFGKTTINATFRENQSVMVREKLLTLRRQRLKFKRFIMSKNELMS